MSIKQQVIIRSQFGSKSVGNYIRRYTSRLDATENLPVDDYILKYSTRRQAADVIKSEYGTVNESERTDDAILAKDGIAFGNRGLSYSDDDLRTAAHVSQEAVDNGHVAILPVISFDYQFLKEHNILDEQLTELEAQVPGAYRGRIDQMKLRHAITEMMTSMSKDMAITSPEWTGCIQIDTSHVHCHLTMVETGEPDPKRMMSLPVEKERLEPVMTYTKSKEDINEDHLQRLHDSSQDGRLMIYEFDERNRRQLVGTQDLNSVNKPKFITRKEPVLDENGQVKRQLVERGMLSERVRDRMRQSMVRDLNVHHDLRPLVSGITQQRALTKKLSSELVASNERLAKQLQILQASLPTDKRLWRAKSNHSDMIYPNQLANQLVDDLWGIYGADINISQFDMVVDDYVSAREQSDELNDDQLKDLRENARVRLRQETINQFYQRLKNIPEEKIKPVSNVSIAGSQSTPVLQDKIAKSFTNPNEVDQWTFLEYRKRAYDDRLGSSRFESKRYQWRIDDFDRATERNEVSDDAFVVRDYYQVEKNHWDQVADKYTYLKNPRQKLVSKQQFNAVRGSDLANVLYDMAPDADRTVSQELADNYVEHTERRLEALRATLDYLRQSGQYKQYNLLSKQRDLLNEELGFAYELQVSQQLPEPPRVNAVNHASGQALDLSESGQFVSERLAEIENQTRQFERQFLSEQQSEVLQKIHADTQASEDYVDDRGRKVYADSDLKVSIGDVSDKERRRLQEQQARWDAEARIRNQLFLQQQYQILREQAMKDGDDEQVDVEAEAYMDNTHWEQKFFREEDVLEPKGINIDNHGLPYLEEVALSEQPDNVSQDLD